MSTVGTDLNFNKGRKYLNKLEKNELIVVFTLASHNFVLFLPSMKSTFIKRSSSVRTIRKIAKIIKAVSQSVSQSSSTIKFFNKTILF